MGSSWNKGFTKYTHPSVMKISCTMRKKRIDNFAHWRGQMKQLGKVKSEYPDFPKNGDFAELIGVVLGDGYIGIFPRTEILRIAGNSNNQGFIQRYASLVEKVFKKKPTVLKRKISNCIDITIYEKYISKRMGIPAGAKKHKTFAIPMWILQDTRYMVRYLRGLYEAEGSFCIHKPTYTYKLLFSNSNSSLLNNVYMSLQSLHFHPHRSKNKVQLSRKDEVYRCKNLIQFRKYD